MKIRITLVEVLILIGIVAVFFRLGRETHIGYRYNSSLTTLSVSNVPLMWEPVGSSNGIPVIVPKPVFKDGVHVLFTDGSVRWFDAESGGRLLPNNLSTNDWRMMAE